MESSPDEVMGVGLPLVDWCPSKKREFGPASGLHRWEITWRHMVGGESGAHGMTTTWPQVQDSSGPPETQEARQDLPLGVFRKNVVLMVDFQLPDCESCLKSPDVGNFVTTAYGTNSVTKLISGREVLGDSVI